MRVLHVVDSLEFGGLERLVTDLALAQKAAGDDVRVFSLLATEGHRAELERQGVPVVLGHKRGGFDRAAIGRLQQVLREQQTEVVHAHSFVPNYYAAAALVLGRLRTALVGTCHDMGTRLQTQTRLRWFFRASLWRTAQVAMVGRQVHRRFVDDGLVPAAKAHTVLNGIPVQRFAGTPARRAAARAALDLPGDALVVGAVGRLVGLKNHAMLLEALARLAPRWPSLRGVILGGGPLQEALAERIRALGLEGRVLLAGHRSGISDLVPAFDLFALPSRTEGVSIALLEAMATGLAVVATRVGGNTEIVGDGETGLLVPSDDAEAFTAAIQALLEDPARRERLAAQAQAWVGRHASIDTVRDTYRRLYRQALGDA